jgi:hypothetical protein
MIVNNELKNWTINFVKNKDMTSKKLVKYDEDEKNNCIVFHFKDKINKHYILEKIDDKIIPQISNNDWKTIVCLNIDDNFNFLIKNWDKLSKINNLSLIFVSLKTQDKWVINPKLHSMIADPDSIKTGLRTMFDTANGKIAEIPKGKKKSTMFEESSNSEDEDPEAEG